MNVLVESCSKLPMLFAIALIIQNIVHEAAIGES